MPAPRMSSIPTKTKPMPWWFIPIALLGLPVWAALIVLLVVCVVLIEISEAIWRSFNNDHSR